MLSESHCEIDEEDHAFSCTEAPHYLRGEGEREKERERGGGMLRWGVGEE